MRIVGLIAAALVLLAGCQGDPDVLEPDPTTSPTPTATPPEMPDQATEDSEEGAAAFVAHWIDVYNYALESGNTDELQALSSKDCEGCINYIRLFGSTYESGGYFRGGRWKVEDADPYAEEPGVIFVQISAGETRYRLDSEADEEVGPPEAFALIFEISEGSEDRTVELLERGEP